MSLDTGWRDSNVVYGLNCCYQAGLVSGSKDLSSIMNLHYTRCCITIHILSTKFDLLTYMKLDPNENQHAIKDDYKMRCSLVASDKSSHCPREEIMLFFFFLSFFLSGLDLQEKD